MILQNIKVNYIKEALKPYKAKPQNVSLIIKGGEFAKLELIDGPTERNAINHPTITFKPVDLFSFYIFSIPHLLKII